LTPKVRAVVAYVASRLISGAESSFVFDFSARGHRSMGGTVNESCVNVYDFSENCQITGHMSNGSFQLFHLGERVHLSLEILGERFRGHDHCTGRHFSGETRGPRVSMKDDADMRSYKYWCEAPQYSQLPGPMVEAIEDAPDSQSPRSSDQEDGA
jgi:hypothetical protein